MKQRILALPAVLALAACQQPANDTNIAIDNGSNVVIHTYPPSENATAGGDGVSPTSNGGAATELPTRIPAPFQGKWGLTSADCTSTKGDAKGLLAIDARRLTFYEAKGTLAKVIAASANSFEARYGFVGEGQTWKRTERFRLANGRLQRLTDPEPGQEPAVNLTYTRCG